MPTRLIVAGAIGGLTSVMTSWFFMGFAFHKYQKLTPGTWRPEGPLHYALASFFQTFAGAMFGMLYYMTGGLRFGPIDPIQRGLLFGFLFWLGAALPSTAINAVFVKYHPAVVVGNLLDKLAMLLLIGLACGIAER